MLNVTKLAVPSTGEPAVETIPEHYKPRAPGPHTAPSATEWGTCWAECSRGGGAAGT